MTIYVNIAGCSYHQDGIGSCTCTIFSARHRPNNRFVSPLEIRKGETGKEAILRHADREMTYEEGFLPGRWHHCEHCGQSYRALTARALKSIPSAIHEKTVCWPCYDGFFDCCWGPGEEEFEYSNKIKKPEKQRLIWKALKSQKREKRIGTAKKTAELRKAGYPRSVARRLAKEAKPSPPLRGKSV